MNKAVELIMGLANLLYPLHCASCGDHLGSMNEQGVCDNCRAEIKRNPAPYCRSCGRAVKSAGDICTECVKMHPSFSSAYSACLYEGSLKDLVHKYKYKNKRILSGLFAIILIDFIKENPGIVENIGAITFVPLHKKRFRERTFNQSELLACAIGRERGLPVVGCLDKIHLTKNQNELTRFERLVNVKGAFAVKSDLADSIKGVDMLLIDDVMTTGATLHEVSDILLGAGVTRVRCLTLARGN